MLLFLINNILIWYQLNSQLVWDWAKTSKAMWFAALMGIPISWLYIEATKMGFIAFEGLIWPGRLLGFAAGIFTFVIWCLKLFF